MSATAPDGACLVVGYDRSDSARAAATWAASQLQPRDRLVIVHACRPLHTPPSMLATGQERRELAGALIDELWLEASDALAKIDVEADISDSDPVSALVAAANRHGAHAIVVGHEPHSRLRRALGTVSSELVDVSPVPVITVPLQAMSG